MGIVERLQYERCSEGLQQEACAEIERLRADLDEQCRLLGMSGEREAKHLAMAEAKDREIARLCADLGASLARFDAAVLYVSDHCGEHHAKAVASIVGGLQLPTPPLHRVKPDNLRDA